MLNIRDSEEGKNPISSLWGVSQLPVYQFIFLVFLYMVIAKVFLHVYKKAGN